jgi:ribonucleoside-diphosphate reductase alpha chain
LTRERLAAERLGLTHSFDILTKDGPRSFYLTCGIYPDCRLGEVFVRAGKEGSLIAGALNGFGISISLGLQYGIPLSVYTGKMRFTQFEPSGIVEGAPPALRERQVGGQFFAKSAFDYIAAYLDWKFPEGVLRQEDQETLFKAMGRPPSPPEKTEL